MPFCDVRVRETARLFPARSARAHLSRVCTERVYNRIEFLSPARQRRRSNSHCSTFPHLPPHICTPGRRTYVDPEHSRFTSVRLKLGHKTKGKPKATLARQQCLQQLSRRMAVVTLNLTKPETFLTATGATQNSTVAGWHDEPLS